jgi:hypothetical protein
MTLPQTKEDVAEAVVAFSGNPPGLEEENVFLISGKGVVSESSLQ